MKKSIPNTITLINLACGCVGIVYCLEGKFSYVVLLTAIALFADFADGLAAKMLNARSELGKQLDSLADAVTFGVLPGTVLYILIGEATVVPGADRADTFLRPAHLGYLFTLFAVLRLGRFNIDTRQSEKFLGLATPAASIFVIGLLVIREFDVAPVDAWLQHEWLLIGITAALCALMVSGIPMFSFKVSGTTWKGNEAQVIFIVTSIIAGILLKYAALPVIILLYVVISIAENLLRSGGSAE